MPSILGAKDQSVKQKRVGKTGSSVEGHGRTEKMREYRIISKILTPWMVSHRAAKARCNNPNHNRFRWYGAKGIKFLMTTDDFKFLWFRDRAHEMKSPTIDRIDSTGNYELSNCRFLERKDNKYFKTHCRNGHKYSEETSRDCDGFRQCKICYDNRKALSNDGERTGGLR